jgi:hypothetical protein
LLQVAAAVQELLVRAYLRAVVVLADYYTMLVSL